MNVAVVAIWRRDAGEVADNPGVVRPVELVGAGTGQVERALLEHDLSVRFDFDDTLIERVADQRIAIAQPPCPCRQRRGIATRIGVGEVLPDNVVVAVDFDFDNPIVVGITDQRVAAVQPAGEGGAVPVPIAVNC